MYIYIYRERDTYKLIELLVGSRDSPCGANMGINYPWEFLRQSQWGISMGSPYLCPPPYPPMESWEIFMANLTGNPLWESSWGTHEDSLVGIPHRESPFGIPMRILHAMECHMGIQCGLQMSPREGRTSYIYIYRWRRDEYIYIYICICIYLYI